MAKPSPKPGILATLFRWLSNAAGDEAASDGVECALDAFRFDVRDWELDPTVESRGERHPTIGPLWRGWVNAKGEKLTSSFHLGPSSIPQPLRTMEELRDAFRASLGGRAAVLSVDATQGAGFWKLLHLYKVRRPARGSVYFGTVTVPFGSWIFNLTVSCPEDGVSGAREATVLDQMLGQRKDLGGPEALQQFMEREWRRDPYRPEIRSAYQFNLSDSAEYDPQFPDNALTRCREHLRRQGAALSIHSEVVRAARPFRVEPGFNG